MVSRLCLATILVPGLVPALIAGAASANAQTMHGTPKVDTSAAGAAAHLQAQGYSGIHDLHKNADGTWTAQVTHNGAPTTVTEGPDGKISSR